MNNYEITRFAQLFNDELTLDNLERIQLVNLCRFVGIPPFGTDAFLASRLRAHLARIKVSLSLPMPLGGCVLQGLCPLGSMPLGVCTSLGGAENLCVACGSNV